jgi:hypothetical protein
MATANLLDCTQLELVTLERVRYFSRQALTAEDMTADQEYFRAKMRRHNRYLHGWGVVCGMIVAVAPTTQRPWQVQVGTGYALGPYGDEIYIPEPVFIDLGQCGPGALTDPCDPGTLLRPNQSRQGATIFLAVRYEECFARPVRVMPGGCGCQEQACETSRIRDSFEIDCLEELPPSHQGQAPPSICDVLSGRNLQLCPPCPADPWVVLARVTLPASGNVPVAQSQIDNFVRRQLFSTAAIQDQVIRCCCGTQERRPARVTSINPPAGTVFTNANTVPPAVIATFSKNLQPATVNANTFQVLRFVPGTPSVLLPGQVSYDDGNRSARFTPNTPFTVPGIYQVTIVGSGPSAIVDSDNLALDGNDDGQPGGNFLSQFTVSVPQPTPTPTTVPPPTPSPTGPAAPLTARLVGPSPVPTAPEGQAAAAGDLRIILNGGTTGDTLQMNISVVLNTNIVRTAGPARCIDETSGDTVDGAVASPNSYVFTGVKTVQPGAGAQRVLQITNMTVQTTLQPAPAPTVFTVQALVSLASATPVPLTPTTQAVLLITPRG